MASSNENDKKTGEQKADEAKSAPRPQGRPLPRTIERRGL